jgi:hypothetical protein
MTSTRPIGLLSHKPASCIRGDFSLKDDGEGQNPTMYTSRKPWDNFMSLGFGDRLLHFSSWLISFGDSQFEAIPPGSSMEVVTAGSDELVEDLELVHSVVDTSFGALTSSNFASALVVETIASVRTC